MEQNPSKPSSSSKTPLPSLVLNVHKAGLENVDKERINQIISKATYGSNFYNHQQKRQKEIKQKVEMIKERINNLSETKKENDKRIINEIIAELENRRVLNRIIVHFDLDMFFAAVEIKNNPSLADKPIAVGSNEMISTSNYVARKYGVRSAMPGFIGKKLCPNLILVPTNFKSYKTESRAVMNIIADYDPTMGNYSLDEVYIDLTEYVFENYSIEKSVDIEELRKLTELSDVIWEYAFEVVQRIRERVFTETQLTISAGISCNVLLAKICSDFEKPNGQFMVKGHRDEVIDFVSKINVRKFPGIGRVRGQLLDELDIKIGSDIFNIRDLLFTMFTKNEVYFFLKISLGIGSSTTEQDDEPQKSHSRELTIGGELKKFDEICEIIDNLSQRLSEDLRKTEQIGRTISLKLKKVTFNVLLKSKSITTFTDEPEVIAKVAKEILTSIMESAQNSVGYRLIGVKISNLINRNQTNEIVNDQPTLFQFMKNKNNNMVLTENLTIQNKIFECVLCESSFQDELELISHKENCYGDIDESLADEYLSSDEQLDSSSPIPELSFDNIQQTNQNNQQLNLTCPICQRMCNFKDNQELNKHIDTCLNRDIVVELTQVPMQNLSDSQSTKRHSSEFSTKRKSKKVKLEQSSPMTQLRNQSKIENFFSSRPKQ
ncbi:hypothetical protein BLOT_008844 [Blomia tropicalis]|nr:hypothetical protein BLOT_008844 [Blomia tropicalis]